MAKVLYIEASPRKERSSSIAVSNVFLQSYAQAHRSDTIERLDLWATALPEFDGACLNAKYNILHGQPHSDAETQAWGAIETACRHFTSADKYVFSVPMWNFGIPYKLKHYIDVITQPGLTFSFSPETGYAGLVTGKPAVIIYSSGGEYGAGDPTKTYDFQKPYMGIFLGFIGFTDVRSILAAPTLAAPDAVKAALERAKQQATELGRDF